jgi:hypothetical protein
MGSRGYVLGVVQLVANKAALQDGSPALRRRGRHRTADRINEGNMEQGCARNSENPQRLGSLGQNDVLGFGLARVALLHKDWAAHGVAAIELAHVTKSCDLGAITSCAICWKLLADHRRLQSNCATGLRLDSKRPMQVCCIVECGLAQRLACAPILELHVGTVFRYRRNVL